MGGDRDIVCRLLHVNTPDESSEEMEITKIQLNLGNKVRLKGGDIGIIEEIRRPLGFREFTVRRKTGDKTTVTALHIDEVLHDDFDVSFEFINWNRGILSM
jgi:hypothetical protein